MPARLHEPSAEVHFGFMCARNLYQHESGEAVYALAIAAPWYATWWAYALYALGAGAIVVGFVGIRTQTLRAEGRRLERVIAERTQENSRA
jgi:hypothetical protein